MKLEPRALSRDAVLDYGDVCHVQDLLDEEQAQSCVLPVTAEKYPGFVLRRYPDAVVLVDERQTIIVRSAIQQDILHMPAMTDGIVDQIVEDLFRHGVGVDLQLVVPLGHLDLVDRGGPALCPSGSATKASGC